MKWEPILALNVTVSPVALPRAASPWTSNILVTVAPVAERFPLKTLVVKTFVVDTNVNPPSLDKATPEPPLVGENIRYWFPAESAATVFTFCDVIAVDEFPTNVP